MLRRQPHPRARAWLTPLAFVLSLLLTLGAFAHRADAQAFKPRSRNGVAAKSPFKKSPAAKATAPAKTPTRTAATTPSRTSATPAKRIVAKKAPPAKKKGKATDDDVVVVDDDEDDEDEE